MTKLAYTYIGKGLYSIPEARRLTKIPAPTLNRWVHGYVRRRDGDPVSYAALLQPSLPEIEEKVALSFRDLVELRFINRLRTLKVSWAEIKAMIEDARGLLNTAYPFGTRRFATDGRRLFSEISDRPGLLLRVRTKQITADRIFSPDLYSEIEFEDDDAVRWRPEAGRSYVVIDPERSFGKPILDRYGISTALIARTAHAEDSIEKTADWFEVPADAVAAAVEFELKLAA